jgi:large subunit ribosomal protein L18e
MVKSKTKISKQLEKKTNPELVETILLAKKNSAWLEVASIISGPRRKMKNVNLNELEKISDKEKIIVVPGKVLSEGEFNKKAKIVALSFSEKAREKLLNSKCDVSNILEEIKSNPNAKDVKILK